MPTSLPDLQPDGDNSTPLYVQLANKLASHIRSGYWQPDQTLPSERTLADSLQLSRVTARKALLSLCEIGLLTRKHGSGTYITPKLEQALSRLTNFSEELRQRGFTPGSQWLSRDTGMASSEEILSLGLSPYSTVTRLKRLRTADNVVMAIENTTLPSIYFPDPTADIDGLYDYLDRKQLAPSRALQRIRAVNANAEQARITGLKPDAPMLLITRIAYLPSGAAVELTHSYCRSDYYDFVVELLR